MSYFGNALRGILEGSHMTQSSLCEQAGISNGQISRYLAGENEPSSEMLDKICAIFPEEERISLVMARLKDVVPASARDLVKIIPAAVPSTLMVQELPLEETRLPLPPSLRKAFDFLERMAVENRAVADSILAAYRVLSSQ